MNIFLYPHGGSGNHGCEAIVRATAQILEGQMLHLFSSNPYQDKAMGVDEVCHVYADRTPIRRFSWRYGKAFLKYHYRNDVDAFERLSLSPLLSLAKPDDLMLSIGGDVYCYGHPQYLYIVNRYLRSKGVKTILWGCSIEPDCIRGELQEDLMGYKKIITRESLTYRFLEKRGFDNVSLLPDPAFLLKEEQKELPESFVEGNTVGINISPLIIRKEKYKGIVLRNYARLINHVISYTDMQVALIPHVVWADNDDRAPLGLLFNHFQHTGRIMMIEDCNARQLKSVIGRCRFLITARTHASIAAYSTQVPTLTVGYSIKADGIATDIFGSAKNYVISVNELCLENNLTKAFRWLMDHEDEIRKHYFMQMPQYINRVWGLRQELYNL